MISIPEQLLESVERGNALLFIGERISRDGTGRVLADLMAEQMVARAGLDPEHYSAFSETAQAYEDKFSRNDLIQFVRDQLETHGDRPQPVHRLIASLTSCKVLVTTCIDQRLEQAFQEAGRPLDIVIGTRDVAFEDERNAQLYKLRGSAQRPESLVLTAHDYEAFEFESSISVVLQGYLARKTIVFVGYDLADPHFRLLYHKVSARLDKLVRTAYAFGAASSPVTASWCRRHNIEVIEVQPSSFLHKLAEQLDNRVRPTSAVLQRSTRPHAVEIPERPYKLLDFYDAGDEAIFFGRDWEIQHLTSLVNAHRLVVLHGASGVGKTSLLRAGILPWLQRADPPYETVWVRVLEDPAIAIQNAVRRCLGGINLPRESSLLDFLDAATQALESTLVIVLDQFEEFFIRFNPDRRSSFIAELGALVDARDVPVKVVFSLREDWLASMSEVEARIPEIFGTKMRLLPLTREQAHQAITQPVEQLGMRYEQALVDLLAGDLAAEPKNNGESAAVMPPQLQLICDALYDRARSEGRDVITMVDYEAVGGTHGILGRYIEGALRRYSADERNVAQEVLKALVTSQSTKAWAGLTSISLSAGTDEAAVKRVLDRLIGARLVRRLDDGEAYELAHDVLAATIAGWFDETDRQLKQVRELLQRELADWQEDRAMVLGQSKFQRIDGMRDRLSLTDEETVFLLQAAVTYAEDIPYWLDQVKDSDAQAEILLEMLDSNAPQARWHAAEYLAGFDQNGVATALANKALTDAKSSVRDRAAASLGQLGDFEGIRLLTGAVETGDSTQRRRALRALALIQDVAPDTMKALDRPFERQVRVTLARIRLQRSWLHIRTVTVAGTVGGAIATSLGLTLAYWLVNPQGFVGPGQALSQAILLAFIFAVLGLAVGASVAFGISAGEAVLDDRPTAGRVLGATILGGLGFALGPGLFFLASASGVPEALQTIVACGLAGMTTGLGVSLPVLVSRRPALILMGGVIGGAAAFAILGVLGIKPFEPTSLPALAVSGTLYGLIMALSIARAELPWTAQPPATGPDQVSLDASGQLTVS